MRASSTSRRSCVSSRRAPRKNVLRVWSCLAPRRSAPCSSVLRRSRRPSPREWIPPLAPSCHYHSQCFVRRPSIIPSRPSRPCRRPCSASSPTVGFFLSDAVWGFKKPRTSKVSASLSTARHSGITYGLCRRRRRRTRRSESSPRTASCSSSNASARDEDNRADEKASAAPRPPPPARSCTALLPCAPLSCLPGACCRSPIGPPHRIVWCVGVAGVCARSHFVPRTAIPRRGYGSAAERRNCGAWRGLHTAEWRACLRGVDCSLLLRGSQVNEGNERFAECRRQCARVTSALQSSSSEFRVGFGMGFGIRVALSFVWREWWCWCTAVIHGT